MQLCERFFNEIVKVLIEKKFPSLKYSAGLFDYGSEVLGFDTKRSTDHDWGPRVLLFLSSKDVKYKKEILDYLYKNSPKTFLGYSTYFNETYKLDVPGLRKSQRKRSDLPDCFEIHTIKSFFKKYLEFDFKNEITVSDWLTFPEQKLRAVRSGKIFYDELGLKHIRNNLHYFPKNVWLYMLASEWTKIIQEEPFVGRTGEVADELGSKIIAARIVHTILKLSFLMEKEYSPYSKWFGTAFSRLKCSKKLKPVLDKVRLAENWKEREKYLTQAYKIIARMNNDLKITKSLRIEITKFYNRPYLILRANRFANEIRKAIKDDAVKKISANIGSVTQFSNSVDLLGNEKLLRKLKVLYK